ncbi:YceI family protein [uncultured Croceitalea sp.]|uniref:YceI family protein n=1 Tax=uncultured Croceitalea sp. TaxID=1798908 RepID=UPI0033068776
MKNTLITLGVILSLSASIYAQNESYDLDIAKSSVKWKGSYLFQFSEHTGTVSFKKGTLYTQKGNITSGSFVVDMTSITNAEYKENPENGPVGHLKNADFFDVNIFPEASLELTKVSYFNDNNEHRFEGYLTIKGISNPIMIRAFADEASKTIKTKFKIDRKDWGITYNSKYKDSAISDAIEFDIILQFK